MALNYDRNHGSCPPYEVLYPCYCHSRAQNLEKCSNRSEDSYECQIPVITCAGDQPINLSQVFSLIDETIEEEKDRYFEWFYLSNTAITSLDENVFHGLQFRNVYIRQCLNLKTINPLAFNNSQSVKHIWINATKLSDKVNHKRDVFKALNSLSQLKTLEVMGSRFTSIPSLAFNQYSSLKSLSFHNYNERQYLKKINSKAFYKLSHLKRIDLRNNRISKINSFAFGFDSQSNHSLRIHLENNELNSNSFSLNAFNGGNGRRIILYLGAYNQCQSELKHLDKNIFEPFLMENKRNVIEMYGCPIECHSRSLWMDRKRLLNKRIRHLKCIPTLILTKVKTNQIISNNNTTNEPKIKRQTKRRSKFETKNQKKNKNSKKKSISKPSPPKMTLKIRLGL